MSHLRRVMILDLSYPYCTKVNKFNKLDEELKRRTSNSEDWIFKMDQVNNGGEAGVPADGQRHRAVGPVLLRASNLSAAKLKKRVCVLLPSLPLTSFV